MLINDKTNISIKELREISIKYLRDANLLSVQACEGCWSVGLSSLKDIVEYFQQYKSFQYIIQLDRNSSQELEKLCKNIISKTQYEESGTNQEEPEAYIQNNLLEGIKKGTVQAVDFFNHINPEQKKIVIGCYDSLMSNYSVRTSNRLKEIGCENFITKYLFACDATLLDIKNLGQKTQKEVIKFKHKFTKEISIILSMGKTELEISTLLQDYGAIIKDNSLYSFYNKHKYLPIFWLLEQEYKLMRSERDMNIFINSYPVFNNHKILTHTELAKKYNISNERIRQIKNNIYEKKITFKEDITKNPKRWQYYKSHLADKKIIWSNGDIISRLLEKERCNFSNSFTFLILSELCKDTHEQFGETWGKCALIHKSYTKVFDFKKLFEELNTLIPNNDSEHIINLDNYVLNSPHWIDFKFKKKNDVVLIVKDILLFEFGLLPQKDGSIKVPANKDKDPSKVVYEILKQSNKPMHLNDIFDDFKQILPNHHYQHPSQLRPIIYKHDKITHIGRKSVYTLVEWEHIKSGTIRDCISDFLETKDLPQSIEMITQYVLQYFPTTNAKNIRSTMCSAPKGQYVRFVYNGGEFFGLKGKKYSPHFVVKANKRNTFEQRLLDFETFVITNNHFPFLQSENTEETSLYRWWNRIISGKQQLSERQIKEVLRIRKEYAKYSMVCRNTFRNALIWHHECNEYKFFLHMNNRHPKPFGEERALYQWLRRVQYAFEKNILNAEQRIEYIELTKLM